MEISKKPRDFTFLILLVLAIVLVANVVLAFQIMRPVQAVTGDLKLTLITTNDCDNCFSLDPFKEFFTQNGVSEDQITSFDYKSLRGQLLIHEYKITKVPTVIISGPVQTTDFLQGIDSIGSYLNGSFVVTKVQPPYYDLTAKRVTGQFSLTYVDDSTCKDCYDISLHDDVLDRMGMHPSSTKTVDINSDEGKQLVEKYKLTEIPTILLNGELDSYDSLQNIWSQVGSVEDDGTYVLRSGVESMGTYEELPSGNIITPATGPDAAAS